MYREPIVASAPYPSTLIHDAEPLLITHGRRRDFTISEVSTSLQ